MVEPSTGTADRQAMQTVLWSVGIKAATGDRAVLLDQTLIGLSIWGRGSLFGTFPPCIGRIVDGRTGVLGEVPLDQLSSVHRSRPATEPRAHTNHWMICGARAASLPVVYLIQGQILTRKLIGSKRNFEFLILPLISNIFPPPVSI